MARNRSLKSLIQQGQAQNRPEKRVMQVVKAPPDRRPQPILKRRNLDSRPGKCCSMPATHDPLRPGPGQGRSGADLEPADPRVPRQRNRGQVMRPIGSCARDRDRQAVQNGSHPSPAEADLVVSIPFLSPGFGAMLSKIFLNPWRFFMASCSRCHVEHSRYRDRNHTKPSAYCLACHAAYMRENRPKHSELSPKQRLAANARSYANVYQRRGKLTPEPCERCGSERVHKHHENYGKPLDVRWLCPQDHRLEHQRP